MKRGNMGLDRILSNITDLLPYFQNSTALGPCLCRDENAEFLNYLFHDLEVEGAVLIFTMR